MSAHFLDSTHPVFDHWREEWALNERRAAGGRLVLKELVPFQYEQEGDGQHLRRQQQAVYLNFPDQAARALTGHLMRHAPDADGSLSFGTLGTVLREEGAQEPTRAELLYYNADGVGRDGSQWDAWWIETTRLAMHTGHRWIMVEAPEDAPRTLRDVQGGRRPWLQRFSPLSVPNWHYEDGRLQFAIVRFPHRSPRLQGTQLKAKGDGRGYLLLVREGYEGLGPERSGGGWWKYDPEKEEMGQGTWEATRGDIPLFPHFYERWEGLEDVPAFSRSGTTEVGQVAVAYMNLSSAARFDAWQAASSMTFLLGVTPEQYRVAAEKMEEGSLLIPIPPAPETGNMPQVHDGSTGAVTADVFDRQLEGMRQEAQQLTLAEATSAPDSSGESKRAGFNELKSPRLSDMAQNLEQAQNTALYFLELRFRTAGAGEPTGSVRWAREFDLADVVDDIEAHFRLETMTGYRSATVARKAMTRSARDRRIIESDEETEAVQEEYREAFDRVAQEEDRARRMERDILGELA